jgi:DNA-binding transcriptional ArsR family regulator
MPGRGASQRTLDAVLAVVPFAEPGQGLRARDITTRLTIVRSPITVRHALRELTNAGLVIGEDDKQHGFRRYRRAPS